MMSMKQLYKMLVDFIFPNRCPCCDKFIKWDKLICDDCISNFPVIEEKICIKCGKTTCICETKPHYDYCFAVTYYEGIIKEGIIKLKLKNGINFAEYFANQLSQILIENEVINTIDIVTAVPMAKKNKSERGYNQAEVLAKFISKEINKPFNNKILKKIKKDLSQHKLTYTERREAVKGAYDINFSNYIKGKTVLICDDVITSSATLNECSRILKQHGARKVICAVIATTNKLK